MPSEFTAHNVTVTECCRTFNVTEKMHLQGSVESLWGWCLLRSQWKTIPHRETAENAPSPATALVFGTWSNSWPPDPRGLLGLYGANMSLKYVGPSPCIAIPVMGSILNWTQCLMGSQCQVQSTGAVWSLMEAWNTMQALMFCTHSSLARWHCRKGA